MFFRKKEYDFNYKSTISNVKIRHNTCKSLANSDKEKNFRTFEFSILTNQIEWTIFTCVIRE